MSLALENTDIFPLQGLDPREKALLDLRKVLQGLIEDFGSILIGTALHPMVESQRDRCLRLGIPNLQVKDTIDEYRRR